MESVYLETTFISYLVANPSHDLKVAAHQQTTKEWWTSRRGQFTIRVSQVVLDEAAAGDQIEAQKRLAILAGISKLPLSEATESLTQAIIASGALPIKAIRDAAHIAVAAVHGVDYLLTWNCKHLANAQIMRRIEAVCLRLDYRMPIICTPDELMEE